MDEAAETMIKNCHACVLNQSLNKNVPLQPVKLPRGPWIKRAVDIVGPMDGKYILTYIDYYSSYPEAHVLKEITSSEAIRVLTDMFLKFSFLEKVVLDNGKQFISAEFEAFFKSCGIGHIRTSPYYARSNGKVDLKILVSYRATPHLISRNSPAKLLFNRPREGSAHQT